MGVIQAITEAISPAINGTGNYLEEVTFDGGSPKVLTVIIDSDTYINLDQVTVVTKQISEILENLPELGETPFTLEVTSPGIDRPLTLPRHWIKNHGRIVAISLKNGEVRKGRIGELIADSVLISDSPVPLDDIAHAQVEIEFKSLKKGSDE